MTRPLRPGHLTVICGSMFAGKSSYLIQQLTRKVFARQTVQLFKPSLDTRYGVNHVTSHSGQKLPGTAVTAAGDILAQLNPSTQVVGIDEVQFFDPDIVRVCLELADRGITVFVAGLNQDYRGEPFGSMAELMCRADHVKVVHAVCVVCGGDASKTYLIPGTTEPDGTVLLGAADKYEARCRGCHTLDEHGAE